MQPLALARNLLLAALLPIQIDKTEPSGRTELESSTAIEAFRGREQTARRLLLSYKAWRDAPGVSFASAMDWHSSGVVLIWDDQRAVAATTCAGTTTNYERAVWTGVESVVLRAPSGCIHEPPTGPWESSLQPRVTFTTARNPGVLGRIEVPVFLGLGFLNRGWGTILEGASKIQSRKNDQGKPCLWFDMLPVDGQAGFRLPFGIQMDEESYMPRLIASFLPEDGPAAGIESMTHPIELSLGAWPMGTRWAPNYLARIERIGPLRAGFEYGLEGTVEYLDDPGSRLRVVVDVDESRIPTLGDQWLLSLPERPASLETDQASGLVLTGPVIRSRVRALLESRIDAAFAEAWDAEWGEVLMADPPDGHMLASHLAHLLSGNLPTRAAGQYTRALGVEQDDAHAASSVHIDAVESEGFVVYQHEAQLRDRIEVRTQLVRRSGNVVEFVLVPSMTFHVAEVHRWNDAFGGRGTFSSPRPLATTTVPPPRAGPLPWIAGAAGAVMVMCCALFARRRLPRRV